MAFWQALPAIFAAGSAIMGTASASMKDQNKKIKKTDYIEGDPMAGYLPGVMGTSKEYSVSQTTKVPEFKRILAFNSGLLGAGSQVAGMMGAGKTPETTVTKTSDPTTPTTPQPAVMDSPPPNQTTQNWARSFNKQSNIFKETNQWLTGYGLKNSLLFPGYNKGVSAPYHFNF